MEHTPIRLDESNARTLVLVRAIDEVDTQGKLLGEAEREQIEMAALAAVRDTTPGRPLDPAAYLRERAGRVLGAVENRQPSIAALRQPAGWQRAWLWLAPLGACIVGAAIDRIDNPKQVNMLSPPLLAVLVWNLAVYLLLVLSPLLPRSWLARGPAAAMQRWVMGLAARRRTSGRLRADVAARFHQLWWAVSAPQQAQWWRQLLHATAAGWGVGLALSIAIGGLVREYRVGWESTLLDVQQVHAILSVLFAPVVALLPMEAFSAHELHRMAFSSGAPVGIEEARRWVWLYIALLAIVVVLPRIALAAFAGWRRRVWGRALRVDIGEPYFADVLARVSPARVSLCLLLRHEAGSRRLLRALVQAADQPHLLASARGTAWTLLTTSREDELRVIELPRRESESLPATPPSAAPPGGGSGWLQDLFARRAAPSPQDELQQAHALGDVVVAVPASPQDLRAEAPLLRWLAKPLLVLAPDDTIAPWREAAAAEGLAAEVLALDPHTRSWLQDKALRDAIRPHIPARKSAGFARIAAAWNERNQQRFEQSMRVLAGQLLHAAAQAEDVAGAPLSLRRIVSVAEREADQRARQAAMDAVQARLRAGEAQAFGELLRLHAIDEPVGAAVPGASAEQFVVQRAVDSPQAGLAGAASGAAMGAGIDLLTGGLTLGAAAALGALVGGAAAFTAAHWKNRATPAGAAQVQPGDEMLQLLTESAVLRYLCVIHHGRLPEEAGALPLPSWKSEVVAAVEAERERLGALWAAARAGTGEGASLAREAAQLLQSLTGRVLARL